ALVADTPAQLADALLACVGLGGHGKRVVQGRSWAAAMGTCEASAARSSDACVQSEGPYRGRPRPSARMPMRASASAPLRHAALRSASRAERMRATACAARALIASPGPHHRP